MDHWTNNSSSISNSGISASQDDFLEFHQTQQVMKSPQQIHHQNHGLHSLYQQPQQIQQPQSPHMQHPPQSPHTQHQIVLSPPSSHHDVETLQQLKTGMAKMMSVMERLEQRLNKVEATTSQILKNQQETLQVPFMSQAEVDKARQVAEQLEQDTSVAKQLQAAYNKEIEMKKTRTTTSMIVAECPICGTRVNQMDLEAHVDNCLNMLSKDPKKEKELVEAKKKIETGFFSKFLKKTKTETKVTTTESATAPLLSRVPSEQDLMLMPNYYPHPQHFGYPGYPSPQQVHSISNNANGNSNGNNGNNSNNSHMPPPMMMPMYMYPSYPPTHMSSDRN